MRRRLLHSLYASLIVGVVFTLFSGFVFGFDAKEMHAGFNFSTSTGLRSFGLYTLVGFCASLLTLKFLAPKR